ncbi:hypothetical protein N7463_001544 [Penicillium fimorum]|uniref:Citrate synthase n=1 Tax=Penicillium fimorum TaxID=1882269 RepID=A0A9W9Y6J8_9EURO|nr:hypothetical protein N7463_001544 [Penicillium fimorum]
MSTGTLFIRDSRTNVNYEIPITRNAVRATDLQRIQAPSLNRNRADQAAQGLRVYDPGLQNTVVTQSAISFSAHEHGLLLYRGYTLDQLWGCEFEEMFHLLLWGTYPTESQYEELRQRLAQYMQEVSDNVRRAIFTLPKATSPLPLILAGLSAYLACIPDVIPATTNATIYQTDIKRTDQMILQTVAAYAVVFGAVRSHRLGIPWRSPSLHQTYYENIFAMAGLIDPETRRPNPTRISCFRRFGNLNAEHGMALTVFSALVTASSLTDPVSCLISAVAAAHGPLHFGATEFAQRALRDIEEPNNVPAFIEEIKSGKRKLFGYGHRTYKGMDPRVRPIQNILKDLTDFHQPLLKVAEAIEEAATNDEYFSTRGLYPNADFYGNFVFTGIGFEPDLIPAAMLTHRIMGIMAHWREYMVTRGKLFRPTHLYTGQSNMSNRDIHQQTLHQDDEVNEETLLLPTAPSSEPYSVFTPMQKRLIILTAALASSFSPLSASIYYPALNSIAKDLRVSPSQINLTITTYMICQGLAPMLTGSLADQAGRRPAYILCFVIYIFGNIALALQHTFPALLSLRAVQSCGSSGTVALASAVAADIITSAERGMYMGFACLGNILAPSIGPIVGGMLSKYLGWQAIFWFLTIAAGTFFMPLLLLFPETCRGIVANGSIPAVGWNQTIWSYLHTTTPVTPPKLSVPRSRAKVPNPCSTLRLLSHRPVGLVLLANGVVFSSYYAVTAGIPALFQKIYDLDDLGIGLCFIPAGLGSLFSATANGVLVDWNYRRARRNAGQTVHKNQKQDIIGFPIEQARLQIGLPMTILAAVSIVAYGVLMSFKPPLLAALIVVFMICFFTTAAYNVMNILIVDLYYETPATAMAANNLVRCFLGAGAAAVVNPLIQQIGIQWTYCCVSGVVALVAPILGIVYVHGWEWRKKQAETAAQLRIIHERP